MTLVEFLLARIAEREQLARNAAGGKDGRWTYDKNAFTVRGDWQEIRTDTDADGLHIARNDPARVLAECDAKRRIVELHHTDDPDGPAPVCHICLFEPPCETLRALAAVYADHPDYREEFRP